MKKELLAFTLATGMMGTPERAFAIDDLCMGVTEAECEEITQMSNRAKQGVGSSSGVERIVVQKRPTEKRAESERVVFENSRVMTHSESRQTPKAEIHSLRETKQAHPTQAENERYMRRIFGSEANLAIAISRQECTPSSKAYPKCLNPNGEHSVGLMQINLDSKAHYNMVPGKTLAEKEEWLKDPRNNALYAHWLRTTSDRGWKEWGGYTDGGYKKYLSDVKKGQ